MSLRFTPNKKERLNIMLLSSLRRVLVASGLVAVTSFMASTAAFAAPTTSVSTTIGGKVDSNLYLAVKEINDLSTTLTAGILQDFPVAKVDYRTNGNGLSITVTGPLELASTGNVSIPFQIGIEGEGYKDDGGTLLNTSLPVPLTTKTLLITAKNPITHVTPGTYSAIFVLTATDN